MDSNMLPAESPATQSTRLGQATASIWLKLSTAAVSQDGAPFVGLVEVRMLPAWLTMAQSARRVQEIPPVQFVAPVTSTAAFTHADEPPVGLADATTSPQESPPAQSVVVGQEIAPIQLPESTALDVHARPSVGCVVVRMCPALSPAAQNAGEAHDTDRTRCPDAAGETNAHVPARLGVLDSRTRPRLSTAAQNAALGHEIEMILFVPSTRVRVQEVLRRVGLVEVITSPAWSPAAQKEVFGHDTASTTTPGLTLIFAHI
jgi:hypothetical protein